MQSVEPTTLSPRQAEIAQMVVSGKSTREIADALTLSPRTVETHIAAIYNKYGVSTRAELMFAVLRPGAGHEASATLPALDVPKTNLPVRRGRLVGRVHDIENVVGRLRSHQLLTLTGAGGIGKTQVALATGQAVLGDFRDGVWLVELAALARGSPVGEALARALSIQPAKEIPLNDALVAYLERRTMLLIIDNCEHVIGEVATLADTLMRSCPGLHILATSREPLRIAGEQTYRLPSLAECSAVELFAQRAQAVDFRFVLDAETAPVVAEICRKVDGIPLAIELAAARVKILSLAALSTKLDSHLEVLTGGTRLALPRHQTMRALIDWSYLLLSPDEQRLFERLSVFAGGCALEQATAVYGDETGAPFGILDLLASLVDKSLLVVDLEAGEPRYALLQSFEQYAAEKLAARGEATLARQRHASVYTVLAEWLEAEYERAPTEAWYACAERELENFAAALDWTLGARRDIGLGQRLVAALRPVWISAGGGQRWLQLARDLTDEQTPALLAARLEHATASAHFDAGEFKLALETSRHLISTYQQLDEPVRAAYVQSLAAYSLLFLGQPLEAEPLIERALHVARAHGRGMLIAFLLRVGANLSGRRGDRHDSRAKLAEALATYERLGASRHATTMIASLAELEFRVGNVEHAFDLATTCLTLQREGKRWRHMLLTLANIAAYSVALNRWEYARAYARETLSLAQDVQHATGQLSALQHLAATAILSANDDASRGSPPSTTIARAAQLIGYVDASVSGLEFAREYTEQQEYDRVLAALRTSVTADDLGQLFARGATLTLEAAIEIALSI